MNNNIGVPRSTNLLGCSRSNYRCYLPTELSDLGLNGKITSIDNRVFQDADEASAGNITQDDSSQYRKIRVTIPKYDYTVL
ncbi:hypothetical protein PPL_04513 [Heterostelium album PN500]|uniref:Uncharacterized protein n=1 Tax=Heterostelium pallidum (strain ATCC 26659 / Pp 5 / PN500) TaxID=670386 RepID=D3B7S5_HETP5|nr:hypothetical protein PPL_04513 [Heterostelium album PN500]EFA82818.1 hypothetical protein PPL_04513 [Heterostelium album PN500]|eukprot:XP_020434935.1 hypothetical protein PPL_04513 [Heterostelium album PN500]